MNKRNDQRESTGKLFYMNSNGENKLLDQLNQLKPYDKFFFGCESAVMSLIAASISGTLLRP